jgi:hypothetical protein
MVDDREKKQNESQRRAFIDAARALGCDESEEHFNEALAKVGRHKPTAQPKPKPKPIKRTLKGSP